MSNLNDKRIPTTMDNHVGIEFEFFSATTRADMVKIINNLGIAKYCNLGTDGSIEPDSFNGGINSDLIDELHDLQDLMGNTVSGYIDELDDGIKPDLTEYKRMLKRIVDVESKLSKAEIETKQEGFELRVCVKEKELGTVLTKLQSFFNSTKAKVNDTCGLHVHIDMRQRNMHSSFLRLAEKESLLFSKCKEYRRYSGYCHKLTDYQKMYPSETGHYTGINAGSAYDEHKTIEVRIKEGTTNCRDVANWINLLVSIVDGTYTSVKKKKAVSSGVKPKRRKAS